MKLTTGKNVRVAICEWWLFTSPQFTRASYFRTSHRIASAKIHYWVCMRVSNKKTIHFIQKQHRIRKKKMANNMEHSNRRTELLRSQSIIIITKQIGYYVSEQRMNNGMIIAYRHGHANLFRCSLINFDGFSGELCMNRHINEGNIWFIESFRTSNENYIIIIIIMADCYVVMWANCICSGWESNESNKTAITAKYVYG